MSEGAGREPGGGGWARIVEGLERAAAQRHVVALRDGMIASVPIILVGSTFLLLGQQGEILQRYFDGRVPGLPDLVHTALGQWYLGSVGAWLVPYRVTMGLLSLYVAFTVAMALARQVGLAPVPQGLGAVAALLVTGAPVRVALTEGGRPEWVLALKPLGPAGLFLAISLALLMVETSRWILRPQPGGEGGGAGEEADRAGVPPAVVDAFRSVLPMLLVVTAVWAVRHGLGLDLQAWIEGAMGPLKELGDSASAVVVVNLLLHVLGVAGLHGISVINAAMLPLWLQFLADNAQQVSSGHPPAYVTAYPLYQFFIWLGGAGATLAPTLLLCRSRHPHLRRTARVALVPGLFNINEPLLFGLPVVANPILAIPFVLAPTACGLVAYGAVAGGWVGHPFIEVPWVVPCLFGAVLSTQDLRAAGLVLGNLALSGLIWWPFLVRYERRLPGGPEPVSPGRGSAE